MKLRPSVIIFDVDGVLMDPRESYHRSALDTVHHFTGKRFTVSELHHWKARPGYNDDWKLTTDWVNTLGTPVTYQDVKVQFMKFYWGNGRPGNVRRERWLAPRSFLRRLGRRYELAVFTGRVRTELEHSFARFRAKGYFQTIVTSSDVARSKPYPDGLLKVLNGRDPSHALYLGDSVDDAAAAQAAHVPFLGILQDYVPHRAQFAAKLKSGGALRVLSNIAAIERHLDRAECASH